METKEKLPEEQRADSFSETFRKIYDGAIGIAVIIILGLFPLYYRDYYYDILVAKYSFYYMTMLGLFGVLLVVSIAALLVDGKEYGFLHTKEFFRGFSPGEIRKHVRPADWFVLAFLIVGIISTMQSDYVYESFWGNEGRFTGLFLHLIYGIGFLVISHLYRFKKWHMDLFLAVAMLPLLFGITDYFNLDLLGFKAEISSNDRFSFMSTFGNINTYATYIGMVFGCLGILLVEEKRLGKIILYVVEFAITSLALIMCNSDNALLAAGLVFALVPLAAFRSRRGLMGYTILLTIFFAMARVTGWTEMAFAEKVISLEGACRMVAELPGLRLVTGALLLISVVLGIRERKKQTDGIYGKKYTRVWGVFLILCVCAGLFVLYDANWGGNSERYGPLSSFLHFSDEWGTYRGLVWRVTMESYMNQPLMHKIWGFGLDTYGVMTMSYRGYTSSICGQVYDSAHNEYLQYLVTLGPIGLFFYLAFLAAALRRMWKFSREDKWGKAIAMGVGCYLLQAMVTINLPIATPIMWMLLSIGMAGTRNK